MNDKKPKSEFKIVKVTLGRVTPQPSNSLKPKIIVKPKD
ncbi:hypothetical protein SAMN05443669_10355 [Flavobacterium xanthum]|uniref:Uncharacterized protein n=1 Tax=Flavobacterium xanthum TaxID=69322 RepID=A0A1M7IJA4_9FLAO|nr:hypothetical protein SAMN05443669_10355 [Flavobacterium xanthum]